MADIVNASEIEIIKGSELPEVASPEGMTFLGYDENSNPKESKRISFSNMTPLFGVTNEEGTSITLAGSQDLVSSKADKQNTTGDEVLYLPDGVLPESLQNIEFIQNTEFIIAAIDESDQILFGARRDGSFYMPQGLPEDLYEILRNTINPKFIRIETDKDGKVLYAFDTEGKLLLETDQLSNIDFSPIVTPIIAETVRINTDAQKIFVFSYFRTDDNSMYLALSDNGRDWIDFGANNGWVWNQGKNTRDPSMIKVGNLFYATYTGYTRVDGKITQAFEIIRSSDLVNWSVYKQYFIPEVENMRHIWAPDLSYINGKVYVIFSASDQDVAEPQGFKTFITELDDNWDIVSTNIIDFGITSTIDCNINYMDGRYIAVVKNEIAKTLRVYISDNILTGYEMISAIVSDGSIEGPSLVKYNGMYRIYYDNYNNSQYSYVESKDLKRWSDPVRLESGKFRHGSVILYNFLDSHLIKNLHFNTIQ